MTSVSTTAHEPVVEPTVRAGGWITRVALAMIALQLAFRAWALSGGYFFGDDFIFLADVARGDADLAWLFHRHNVHLMPVGFLLVLPVAAAGGFAWGIAALQVLLLQAVAALACWWMLRTLFGQDPRILLPLGFFLFSAISMPALMWWAAAINMIAVQTAIFLAIGLHVLYLRTGRRRFVLLAALAILLGLGSYLKALAIPLVLAILTVVYFTEGAPAARIRSALTRFWPAWVLYGAAGLGYLAAYVASGESPTDAGSVSYAGLAETSVLGSLVPGLLGGPWTWVPADIVNGPRVLSAPSTAVQTLSVVVLVALLGYLAARFRGALRPLWFLVPYVALTIVILGAGRVATFGTAITMELRYWTDFLPYVALAIGLMTIPLPGSKDPLRLRDPAVLTWRAPRSVTLSLVVAFLVGSLVSSISYVQSWHDDFQAKTYVKTVSAELGQRDTPLPLANDNVPEPVLQGLTFPYNRVDHILAPLSNHFDAPDVANGMHVVGELGAVVPAIARPDTVVPPANLERCLDGGDGVLPETIDLGSPTFNFPFWASIVYRSDRQVPATISAGRSSYDVEFLPGLQTLSFRTEGSYDAIRVRLPAGSRVCISNVQIGQEMIPR